MRCYYIYLFLILLLVVGCAQSQNEAQDTTQKVTIRSSRGVSSVFYIDNADKLISSETTNSRGIVTKRSYEYDKSGDNLSAISRSNNFGEKKVTTFAVSSDRSDSKISKIVKIANDQPLNSRNNESNVYSIEYIYDRDTIIGIRQIDRYGNELMKIF